MTLLPSLTESEIEVFASRTNVKRVGVENFLGTVAGLSRKDALANLHQDARCYRWNSATVAAIKAGIDRAEKKRLGRA